MRYRANRAVHHSGGVVIALDILLPLNAGSGAVGDVDDCVLHEVLDSHVSVRVVLLTLLRGDRDFLGHDIPELAVVGQAPVVYRGGDDQSVAINHHLGGISLDG